MLTYTTFQDTTYACPQTASIAQIVQVSVQVSMQVSVQVNVQLSQTSCIKKEAVRSTASLALVICNPITNGEPLQNTQDQKQ